jgi:pseudouridine-5'-phosphate glycosidase
MMDNKLSEVYILKDDVALALGKNQPIVALESTVITHGLPRPDNLNLARALEDEVRKGKATPATVAVMNGKIHIGLTDAELERLANTDLVRKISRRDYGVAIARGESGGTTVAGTLIAAAQAGLRVFATGGIGGVHRQAPFDVSADLQELARTPMVVVCAGAKAILDIPATLEYLETVGVPVVGYGTDDFPAFYSTSSGRPVTVRADTPDEVARIARAQWDLGICAAVLVAVPPPLEDAIPPEAVEGEIQQALADANARGIYGAKMTPFLLARVSELTGGASLRANLSLLRNNARVAALIAGSLAASSSHGLSA